LDDVVSALNQLVTLTTIIQTNIAGIDDRLDNIAANTLLSSQALDGAIRHPFIGSPYFQISATIEPPELAVPVILLPAADSTPLNVTFNQPIIVKVDSLKDESGDFLTIDNINLKSDIISSITLNTLVTNTGNINVEIENTSSHPVIASLVGIPIDVNITGSTTLNTLVTNTGNINVEVENSPSNPMPVKVVNSISAGLFTESIPVILGGYFGNSLPPSSPSPRIEPVWLDGSLTGPAFYPLSSAITRTSPP